MVWQPDVVTEIESTVSYDSTSVAALQPEVVIELPLEVVYTAPASTGGQPDVITEIQNDVELGEMQPYADVNGTSNIAFSSDVTPSIDVELVSQPSFLTNQLTRIVSYVTIGAPGPVRIDVAATLPALEQAATGEVEIRADITSTLPALEQSADVNVEIRADITSTLPALEQSADVNVEITGDITATLPALEQSADVNVEIRADIAATLPALEQDATGTVTAASAHVTADIAATLPALEQSATGTVGSVAAEISDDFNRADEPLEDSADWVVTRQDADIVSNQLVVDAVKAFHQTALSSDDHYVQFDVVDAGGGSLGAYLRHDSASGESNGYHARRDGTSTEGFEIYRFDSGSLTSLGSTAGPPTVDGDVLRFEIEGSTIRCLLNGVEELSVTDTTHTTGKYVGLREGRGVSITIDNFEASAL